MIRAQDIVGLDIDNSWFRSGLDYSLISWTSTFNRMGKPNPYNRIEKILIGIIAEKAVESYLTHNAKNFETAGKTKWYEIDRYDLGIRGYSVDIKSNFLDTSSTHINNKYKKISNRNDKLAWFLKCHALVPVDQLNPGNKKRRAHNRDRIYVFPFIEGYFKEQRCLRPLIHAFWDYKWLKRAESKNLPNLGRLEIEYTGSKKFSSIKIYGTTEANVACIEEVNLNSSKIKTINNFFQVFSLEWTGDNMPNGNLTILSTSLNLREIISPQCSFTLTRKSQGYWPSNNNWQNLTISDAYIYLLGWIKEEEFRINGCEYKRFTKNIEQYAEIKVDNWGCPVNLLEPMNRI